MSASTAIPVDVTPEAAARIAELGMQTQLNQMIEHVRQAVPDLRRIEVVLYHRYDLEDTAGISVNAFTSLPLVPDETTEREIDLWAVSTFPPEVLEHFVICVRHGSVYAG
jgi:hypothetical protein